MEKITPSTEDQHRLAVRSGPFCYELTGEQRRLLASAIMELRAAARRLGEMEAREARGLCFTWERHDAAIELEAAEATIEAMGVPL